MQSVREANTTCLVVRRPWLAKKRWKMKTWRSRKNKKGGLRGARSPPSYRTVPRCERASRSSRLILRVGAGPRSAVCGGRRVRGGCQHACQSRQSTQKHSDRALGRSPRPVPPVSLSVPRRARSGLAADQPDSRPTTVDIREPSVSPRRARGAEHTGALHRRPWTRIAALQRRRSEALECGHPSLWGDAEGCRELAPDQERFEPGTSGV